MGYVFLVVGLLVLVAILVFVLPQVGGRRGHARERKEEPATPHAEKEQMNEPQEEFVDDQPPSRRRG